MWVPGEESYLCDEPLSPSRALRAAMLRSRFAGTIVKAQQKALLDHVIFQKYMLNFVIFYLALQRTKLISVQWCSCCWHAVLMPQGKNIDPVKLQLEKERLEKRQQEGKCHI
jgi:hypothetical protein